MHFILLYFISLIRPIIYDFHRIPSTPIIYTSLTLYVYTVFTL